MCGIYCTISANRHVELDSQGTALLARRGPDALNVHKVIYESPSRTWYLTFYSSVLSLRGSGTQVQPMVDTLTGSAFCWNGEAWLMNQVRVSGNDTQVVFKSLMEISSSSENKSQAISHVLGSIKGPFAFAFYDAPAGRLYYGRDVLGRRSLLIRDDLIEKSELTVCSADFIGQCSTYQEVPTPQVFCVDLTQPSTAIQSYKLGTWTPKINKSIPAHTDSIGMVPSESSIQRLLSRLTSSLELRVEAVPTYTVSSTCTNLSKVAILFSGGLDCTLLARLLHDLLPVDQSVDLLNVAFENPRVVNARAKENPQVSDSNGASYETCPDRMTGRSSFAELSRICPERQWRFVAINVAYTEFLRHRPFVIQLMYPHNTEMDLSITAALYFAARGTGDMTTNTDHAKSLYTTSARVLLSGLGADELFGGYARHAAAFTRDGYSALNDELELDYERIGSRNLGRDDRVISHWGRETRYPFLDEDFIEFALNLPSWEKCGFRLDRAIPKHFELMTVTSRMEDLHPEKLLLRCALWRLSITGAAAEKKRAIQFGARTAKMHVGRTKGTDIITREAVVEVLAMTL